MRIRPNRDTDAASRAPDLADPRVREFIRERTGVLIGPPLPLVQQPPAPSQVLVPPPLPATPKRSS